MIPVVENLAPIEFVSVCTLEYPERHLRETARILDEQGLKWCFAFGTALGLRRDGGFIPQDTDIDVMILGDEYDFQTVCSWFFHLNPVRTVRWHGKYHQISFVADDGFIIDLCFFAKDGDNYVSYCEGGYWVDGVSTIGQFKSIRTAYGSFPVPEQIEDYLVSRYGADWRVPKYGQNGTSIKEQLCELS